MVIEEEKIVTIIEPIYFKVIKEKLKNIFSKNKYTLTKNDLQNFNSLKISQNEIDLSINKFEKINERIVPNYNRLKRQDLFNFLDGTNINYSPQELNKFGLSQSFTGSLIFTFLKYDFEQKYENPFILNKLTFDENKFSEKESDFLIEKGHLILDKMTHENFRYFIFIFLNKLETVMDIYLEDISSHKQKSLILIYKYIKIIKKLLKRLRGDSKAKIISLSHKKNSELGRKYSSSKNILELKEIINEHIYTLKDTNSNISEIIDLFNEFEENIKKGIDDKDLLLKIKKVFKFEIGYETPEGGKFYLKKN